MAALPGNLKDFIRAQMPGLFADYLQYSLALSREATTGGTQEPFRVGGREL